MTQDNSLKTVTLNIFFLKIQLFLFYSFIKFKYICNDDITVYNIHFVKCGYSINIY
jgi:hypothetical protein